MDVYDDAFLGLWRILCKNNVRYIMVGGFATNFHGYQRYTGDIDIYIDISIDIYIDISIDISTDISTDIFYLY